MIRSQMHNLNEADLEEIKKVFLAILKDIKKDLGEQNEKRAAVNREIIRRISEEAMALGPGNIDLSMMAEIVAGSVREVTNADEGIQQKLKELLMDIANAAGAEVNQEARE